MTPLLYDFLFCLDESFFTLILLVYLYYVALCYSSDKYRDEYHCTAAYVMCIKQARLWKDCCNGIAVHTLEIMRASHATTTTFLLHPIKIQYTMRTISNTNRLRHGMADKKRGNNKVLE